MAIYSIVKFDGFSDREWIIYRHPVTAINNNSRLFVGMRQSAIVVSRGKVEKVFSAGTYVFNGENFPFISGLGMRSREGSSFDVDIYFFNKSISLSMLWGTMNPIEIADGKTNNLLRVRARGQYLIKLMNFQIIISILMKEVTNNNLLEHRKLSSYLRDIIINKLNEVLNEFIVTNRSDFPKINYFKNDLEKQCFGIITNELKRLGLQLDTFNIDAISVFEEDIEILGKIVEAKVEPVVNVEITDKVIGDYEEFDLSSKEETKKDKDDQSFATRYTSYKNKEQHKCPRCSKLSDGYLYCPYCGSPMKIRCVLCNNELTKEDEACPKCGTKVSR